LRTALTVTILATLTSQVIAGPFTVRRNKNNTELKIVGPAAENFSVTAPNPTPPPATVTLTGTTNLLGILYLGPVGSAVGTATVTNTSEPAIPAVVAEVFTPGVNTVVSAYTIAPGSMLTSGADTFVLTGGYTTVDTFVDMDPSSPNYGLETGFVKDLNINASGSAGDIQFVLGSSPTYSLNLASVWGLDIPAQGLSVPLLQTFSGTLTFNSITSSFSGSFDGTDTFFDDGSTTAQGTLTFDTDFGVFSGSLSASAQPILQAVPEPGSLAMFGIGVICLAGCLRRPH